MCTANDDSDTQHAVTHPLTLFIAHSLLSLSLVADCNIRNIHFNTTSNTVTTLYLYNVTMWLITCPFSKMPITFMACAHYYSTLQLHNQLYLLTDFNRKHDYKFWGFHSGVHLRILVVFWNVTRFPTFQKKLTISPITVCPNVAPLYTQATPALSYWPALFSIQPPIVTSPSYSSATRPFLVLFMDTGPMKIRCTPPKCWNNSLSDTHQFRWLTYLPWFHI